VADLKS